MRRVVCATAISVTPVIYVCTVVPDGVSVRFLMIFNLKIRHLSPKRILGFTYFDEIGYRIDIIVFPSLPNHELYYQFTVLYLLSIQVYFLSVIGYIK